VFIAAGNGESGNSSISQAMAVGLTEAAQLGFARKQTVSHLEGNPKDKINNERLQQIAPPSTNEEVLLRPKKRLDPEARKTDLPVPEKQERRWTAKVQRAASSETTASVGTSYGSTRPSIQGGIGIGDSSSSGLGTGIPGGSEYGRRIQTILSRNFTPPTISTEGTTYVVIYVKIARSGQILSVAGGRVPRNFFKQVSTYEQLNYAAERAVLAAAGQGLPPFPGNFLLGSEEAVAEVWFQYP
jgi:hypothetical protein